MVVSCDIVASFCSLSLSIERVFDVDTVLVFTVKGIGGGGGGGGGEGVLVDDEGDFLFLLTPIPPISSMSLPPILIDATTAVGNTFLQE